jgi:hypothetical protein
MVNVRFTTFTKTDHAEMVRKAPKTKAKPQRTRRSTKKEATGAFTAKGAENAKKEGQAGLATAMPRSEERSLPQRAQRNTEEEATPSFTAKDAKAAKNEEPAGAGRNFTAEHAEVAEKQNSEEGTALRVEDRLEPQNAEGIPGVESAKSIFFGVEVGEGVADNRPVMSPSEPPRKSSQSEVLVVPKDEEHYARR